MAQLNCKGLGEVLKRYPEFTNVMNQITLVPAKEQILVSEREGPLRSRALRPEQKSVAEKEHFLSKFSKPGHLVVDPCVGDLATVKSCMMLRRHLRFVCVKSTRTAASSLTFP